MTKEELFKLLNEPFPAHEIEWRLGQVRQTREGPRGVAFAYITARAVMDRLDMVFGVGEWETETEQLQGGVWKGAISARIGGDWVSHEDVSDETDIEAAKGGASGALKRVAVRFGVGRYLYYLGTSWIPVEEAGRNRKGDITYRIPEGGEPTLPEWALPGGAARPPVPEPNNPPPQEEAPQRTVHTPRPILRAPPPSAGRSPAPATSRSSPPTSPKPVVRFDSRDDPDVGLPAGTPPFNISEAMKIGKKYDEATWAHMAAGGPDGRRRKYLHWLAEDYEPRGKYQIAKIQQAKMLLDWLEGDGAIYAESNQDERPDDPTPEEIGDWSESH